VCAGASERRFRGDSMEDSEAELRWRAPATDLAGGGRKGRRRRQHREDAMGVACVRELGNDERRLCVRAWSRESPVREYTLGSAQTDLCIIVSNSVYVRMCN
jgi:hypothetical protein